MRNITVLLIFVLTYSNLCAQTSNFEFSHSQAPFEVGYYGFENSAGNFIISSTAATEGYFQSTNINLFELDSNGELINMAEFQSEGDAIAVRVFEMEDHYLTFGSYEMDDFSYLQVMKIGFDFELLSDSLFEVGPGDILFYQAELIDDIIYGVGRLSGDNLTEPVVIKLTNSYDVELVNFEQDCNSLFNSLYSSIVIDENTNNHIICAGDELKKFDQNFNFIENIQHPFSH